MKKESAKPAAPAEVPQQANPAQPQMSQQDMINNFVTQEVIKELETQRNQAHARCAGLASEIANAKVALSMAQRQIDELAKEVNRLKTENEELKKGSSAAKTPGKKPSKLPEDQAPQPGQSGGID